MRAFLLAALMIALLPGVALAHPPRPSGPTCGQAHVDSRDGNHCVSGAVVLMEDSLLAVQPAHDNLKLVLSDDGTVYKTNSGAAALEGLQEGDYVCVAGYMKDGIMKADVVTFDIYPFSCDH